jgi:protein-S-isoprenylcysteine O-methyltransferase Ste14
LQQPAITVGGLLLAVAGFIGIPVAQSAMGRSWRIGVDPGERTDLVTHGPFRLVRNPVFTAMITASAGLTTLTPTWPQLLAMTSLVAGIQLQVRVVEEPYLIATHDGYAAYAARVGRFLPLIGRHRPTTPGHPNDHHANTPSSS